MIGASDMTARPAGGAARTPVGQAVPSRIAAAVLLVLSLPLWLAAAVVVWLSVGRPVFFRQSRSGLAGRPFLVCKFRTMHDRRDPNGQLLPDAMRETPATRLMRAVRIDELPQLLAIMRGEMAFIGPRPLLATTIAEFGELGRIRGTVRPGLSGWAQVNGNTRLTNREKLALDLWYVRNRSLGLDLRILLLTLQVALLGERVDRRHVEHALKAMNAGTVRS
jgi:lipopolysaccharide/colanic/teichoic acid biosynthesis glycosyltransferase